MTVVNPLCADTITPHIAAIVLHHFRSGDLHLWRLASSGERAILDAATLVDPTLMRDLLYRFPGLYAAIVDVRAGRITDLERVARGEAVVA